MPIPTTTAAPATMQEWRSMESQGHDKVSVNAGTVTGESQNGITHFFKSFGDDYNANNKAAFEDLMTAIHQAYPVRSDDAMEVLQGAYDAGKPLSSRLIEKAIHAAENSTAHILDKHDGKDAVYSVTSPAGIALLVDTNALVARKMQDANPQNDGERLAVIASIMLDIDNAPSVGDNVKDKMRTLINIQKEKIVFSQIVDNLNLPHLGNLQDSKASAYRFVMDGNRQDTAFREHRFENERGYLASTLHGFNYMLSTLNQPLTADLYEKLHDTAVDGVHERNQYNSSSEFDKGYRDCGVTFGLVTGPGGNATVAGLHEFSQSAKQDGGWIELTLPTGNGNDGAGNLLAVEKSAAQCRQKAADIIATYQQEIVQARAVDDQVDGDGARETAILTAIAKCCQDLDQHHLFSDGNIRSVAFLTMNKLLLQEGLKPTIFNDPNDIDMHSVNEIVGLIRAGQQTFDSLC